MGGEWNFALLGDPATIDVKKYQQELIKIRQRYRYDPKLLRCAQWFSPTESQKEPTDNIFARFSYKCTRHTHPLNCHKNEPGANGSQNAWWVLYWDPSKFQKGYNPWGDIFTRCSPRDFIYKSATMQHHLAVNFPEHFQLYLGDGIDGCGDRELYWGVKPKHLEKAEVVDSDTDSDAYEYEPHTSDDEWFLETM
ncbi:hypothetical protein HA402_007889 [Bradysia odoriphaga]|nr:hypothetical protein HA402_007889 [Bradysia odoriphaga]